MTGRADSFAKVAEWADSIQLRNAALVIQPDDVDQRMKLLNECIALSNGPAGTMMRGPGRREPVGSRDSLLPYRRWP